VGGGDDISFGDAAGVTLTCIHLRKCQQLRLEPMPGACNHYRRRCACLAPVRYLTSWRLARKKKKKRLDGRLPSLPRLPPLPAPPSPSGGGRWTRATTTLPSCLSSRAGQATCLHPTGTPACPFPTVPLPRQAVHVPHLAHWVGMTHARRGSRQRCWPGAWRRRQGEQTTYSSCACAVTPRTSVRAAGMTHRGDGQGRQAAIWHGPRGA